MKTKEEITNGNLICSAPNKYRLTELINRFYCSQNFFINENNEAENRVTNKKLGKVTANGKRWKYFV